MKKLAVLFPGKNYSTDCPLLYFAESTYRLKGYEIIRIKYNHLNKDMSIAECINIEKSYVLMELSNIDYSSYDEILFISKSMGTAIAGWIEEVLNINVRHIYLTPLLDTFKYMKCDNCIVIAGTKDRYLDSNILKDFCIKSDIELIQYKDAGHSITVSNDVNKSIEYLADIVKYYR